MVNNTLKLLCVANLGSTSFKCKLYRWEEKLTVIATAHIENIGKANSLGEVMIGQNKNSSEIKCNTHLEGFNYLINYLISHDVFKSLKDLTCIAYKAVHGGPLKGAMIINDSVINTMKQFLPFAPVHNSIYITLIEDIRDVYPNLLQAAYFETSFHTDIPEYRSIYGIPYEWKDQFGIKKYGFHGSSHGFIAHTLAERFSEREKIISLHLGGSSSICAIYGGKSIATSFGATPQSGLFQNNRVGDFDVFCIPALIDYYKDLKEILQILSSQSGFLGISGESNDFRDIQIQAEKGNKRAQLAMDAFIDNCIGFIGMYWAYLEGIDALVFTGGIGNGSIYLRKQIAEKLSFYGVRIDDYANENGLEIISDKKSSVRLYNIKTDEEFIVATKCIAVM